MSKGSACCAEKPKERGSSGSLGEEVGVEIGGILSGSVPDPEFELLRQQGTSERRYPDWTAFDKHHPEISMGDKSEQTNAGSWEDRESQ